MSKSKTEFQVERIAFFSDAVLAIAITLLIIEVKPPHIHDVASAFHDFTTLIPMFVGVAFSFTFIGVFWYRHHMMFKYITNYNTKLVVLNLVFLCTIIFIPFSTAFTFENSGTITLPFVVYNVNYALVSIANLILLRYALNPSNNLAEGVSYKELAHMSAEIEWGIVVYSTVAFVAAYTTSGPIWYALFGLIRPYSKLRLRKYSTN